MNSEPIFDAVSAQSGAPCPLHPGAPSVTACGRCGSFMCETCVGLEADSLCPTCSAQTYSFPLRRSDWSVSGLFSVSWEAFKRQWLMLSVAFVVFMAAYYAFAFAAGAIGAIIGGAIGSATGGGADLLASGIMVLLMVGGALIISVLMALGFNRICLDVLQEKPVSIGTLFSQVRSLHLVLKLWGALMLLYGVAGGAIAGLTALMGEAGAGVGALLFIPFGVALGLVMPLLMVGFVVHPEMGFIAHVRRTLAMMHGEVMGCIGTMFTSGLVVMGGALLCGIGMIPAYGLTMMLMVGLYLALENDPAFNIDRSVGLDTIR
jgi:hypothetical protein